MSKILYIVRHGRYDMQGHSIPSYETAKYPLLEGGIEDVEELTNKLRQEGRKVVALYTSPFKRTRQTAEILSKGIGVKVEVVEDLKETTKEEYHSLDYESLYDRMSRSVRKALSELKDDQACIIVSHRDPISTFINHEKGISYKEMKKDRAYLKMIPMGACFELIYEDNSLESLKEFFTPKIKVL